MKGVANIEDVRAIEARGQHADLPANTYEMICRGAAINPSAPALSFFATVDDYSANPECWTYTELLRDITRTANLFSRLGVQRGSVVAYVLPNLPETHFVIWGAEAVGIVCAINPLLEAAAIGELLNASGATVLVTLAPFPGTDLWQKVHSILDDVPSLNHVVLVDLADHMTGEQRSAAWKGQRADCPRPLDGGVPRDIPARIIVHDFNSAIACESSTSLTATYRMNADDVSSYFCTGGTTGLPKIAMRRHGNEVANAWSAGQFFGDGVRPGKTMFCGLPLFHVNAAMVTGLLPFSRGAHVVLGTPQGYRAERVIARFWQIVERYRVNFFSGVPTLYGALLEVPIDGCDVSSLEFALCGAAPMPAELLRAFQARTGIRILEGYGLTEGTCISTVNPPLGERRPGSIGLPLPGQAMKAVIVDDTGRYLRDCLVDEPGQLVISGPNVFSGYARPEQNHGIWMDLGDGDRWLNTGDIGRCDADGYFWLTGRKKELIIRGGHNIDPAAIEEPLHRHPAVRLAAAIGRPDVHAGELPVVYVEMKTGMRATEAELSEFLRREIHERAALPKAIRIVDAMPLTGVGKIFKPALRSREMADALQSALVEAGVKGAGVSVIENTPRGISAHVELPSAEFEEVARATLGRFPFAFSLSVSPNQIRQR